MDSKNHIIELVVYNVKANPANNKEIILAQTNEALAKFAGYLFRQVFQSVDNPTLLLDYVAWDTLENAVHAAKNMGQVPELGNFIKLIQKTELFEHFHYANSHLVTEKATDSVELIIYQLKDNQNEQITHFFNSYSHEIAKAKGYNNRVLLQSSKINTLWAERVYWDTIALAQENEKVMQQNANLNTVFSLVDKVVMKQLFQEFK